MPCHVSNPQLGPEGALGFSWPFIRFSTEAGRKWPHLKQGSFSLSRTTPRKKATIDTRLGVGGQSPGWHATASTATYKMFRTGSACSWHSINASFQFYM